jgi:hypothetical protein
VQITNRNNPIAIAEMCRDQMEAVQKILKVNFRLCRADFPARRCIG